MSDFVNRWIRLHSADGMVREEEVADLSESCMRILNLLSDMDWHNANEIRNVAGRDGLPASEGLRRMRDLRPALYLLGLEIIKQRQEGSRLFSYKIEKRHD